MSTGRKKDAKEKTEFYLRICHDDTRRKLQLARGGSKSLFVLRMFGGPKFLKP